MKKVSINRRSVDAITSERKEFIVWDRDLKGFGMRVSPGGTKAYIVQYRLGGRGSPVRRITIGRHDSPWTPAAAREEGKRLLYLAGLGQDPCAEKQEQRQARATGRFEQFAEVFLEHYASRNWAAGTYSTHNSNIDRWLVPALGKIPLGLITRKDVTRALDRIPADHPALPRNVFVLLRTMLNWAVERGELEKSPMAGMRVPRSAPERHHILSDDEVVVVAATALKLGPVWGNMILMLLITGQRRGEVANADWSEFDRAAKLWTIPRERTKNGREHIVPLNVAAIATLDACAGVQEVERKRWPKQGFVFSHIRDRPVSGFSKLKGRLDAQLALNRNPIVRPWRFHDLRRTVATNMQRLGVRFEVTEAILNHVSITQAGVASVYQRHDWLEEKREAFDAWGEKIASMIEEWRATHPDESGVAATAVHS